MINIHEERINRAYYDVTVHQGRMVKELKKALDKVPDDADLLNVRFDGFEEVTFHFVVER